MKFVTLTKDLRPWRANDRVPVPDALADELVALGDAKDPEWFTPDVGLPLPTKKTPTVERVLGAVKEGIKGTLRLPTRTDKKGLPR